MQRRGFLLIVAVVALALSGCHTKHVPASSTDADTQAGDTKITNSAQNLAPHPEGPPAPVTARPQISDTRPLVVCFGDSLTAGHGTDLGQSYPDYLQADLDALGYRYRVVNEGISGNTTKDGVDRLGRVLSMKPSVVVVEFGGNDGLRGLPIADTRANLDKIIGTLKSNRIKVVLAGITLPPNYGPDYIQQFNATYTLLARKYHVPMLPFLLKGVFGVPGMMQEDMTHATAAGNKIVAKNILPLVTPLLKRAR
ncbi:arylesterase [Edaphobacter sp.]|uniref:arylesterase n=1 Tax=Edaphobacter sp. TaxID=1934404 RepID=UPI002DB64504|nr:arylesterase [Edaphobacter sp.]HEU5341297.1 arylesterase [Edaphobacter sp.]